MELPVVRYYESVARAFDLVIEDGMLYALDEEGHKPIKIADRPLAIPNKKNVNTLDWTKVAGFHPLCEVVSRGPSEVIALLSKMGQVELNIKLGDLINKLVTVAVDKTVHDKMLPDQFALLKCLSDADKKFHSFVCDPEKGVLAQLEMRSKDKLLARLKMRRMAEIDGVEYKRYCAISFPCVPTDDHAAIFGVSGRVKDIKMFRELLDYILPGHEKLSNYSYGTSRKVAPYLGALLGAYSKVMTRINEIVDAFSPTFPEFAELRVDLSMNNTEFLEILPEMAESIPAMRLNEGTISRGGDEAQAIRLSDPEPAQTIGTQSKAKSNDTPPWEEQPKEQVARLVEQPAVQKQTYVKNDRDDTDDMMEPGELLARTRAAQQQNLYGQHYNPHMPQHQQVVQPAPGEPQTLYEMMRSRSMVQNLQIGQAAAAQQGANYGISPLDVNYKPTTPQQVYQQPVQQPPNW